MTGTIQQKLITGVYTTVAAFAADCRLVTENCKSWYAGNDESFVAKANRINQFLDRHLNKLMQFDQSVKGVAAKAKVKKRCMTIKKPEKDFLKGIMTELRATTYTDKAAKVCYITSCHNALILSFAVKIMNSFLTSNAS